MENDPMMSSPYHTTTMNNDPLINKSGFSSCNLQLNSNSNPNNGSISNNIVGGDVVAITNHHAMMKSGHNVVGVTSDGCNKLQLREQHSNLNVFISNADANNRNVVNDESSVVKDDNYKNHLMNGASQKFNLNNKHISCQQQQQQADSQTSISYGQMMNDINRSSLPLNLCQVSIEILLDFRELPEIIIYV